MLNFKKWSTKTVVKEILTWIVVITVLSNVVSYLRKPILDSSTLPDIEVKLLDGTPFNTEMLNGTPLVIHFWGTWCPTCRVEASNIALISQGYTVLTIAVNSGSDAEISAYLKEHELSYNVLNDRNGAWAKKFKVEAFPTTFIYDGRGELRFTEVGYTTIAGLLARLKLL